jgi:hypothetical protein
MAITQTRLPQRFLTSFGAIGALALVGVAGCSSGATQTGIGSPTSSQTASLQPSIVHSGTAGQTGAPIVVSCEPHQRTLVRPVVVNGATVSQVECIAAPQPVAQQLASQPQFVPTTAAPVAPQAYAQAESLPDARLLPVSQPATVARPIPARQVVYTEPRRVESKRSVKKSAIIIGSSAGAGAGVGAAIGGKKGALIGAAIGGGGAALWDQITRR